MIQRFTARSCRFNKDTQIFPRAFLAHKFVECFGPQRRIDVLHTAGRRSEEHTSELQSLMRISYAVFCLKKKNKKNTQVQTTASLTSQNKRHHIVKRVS